MTNKKTVKRWKFLRKGMKSENGDVIWKKNKWVKVDGELEMCKWGLHCSKEPYDAFYYVHGEIVALVECRGKHLTDDDKECWEEQRVIKTYRWTKRDSVRLTVYSAKLVLKYFEEKYPEDKRPRKMIEAAERWLKNPTRKNLTAAYVAYAAYAYDAAYTAYAAAYTAAADAAYAAAADAAYAAVDAASVADAASAAARKIRKYFKLIIKEKMK